MESAQSGPPPQTASPLPEAILRHNEAFQAALRSGMTWGPPELQTLLHYHLGWVDQDGSPTTGGGGKALRPALCMFASEAVGGRAEQAIPAAVALEVVHNFSLIHDDIQDQDLERRNRPTVWAVWGKPRALVAGNAMRALADTAMGGLISHGADPAGALEAARVLTERCLEMIEGQYMDLNFETRRDVTTAEYMEMVSKKTGALLEAAMHLGALLGGGSPSHVSALRRSGRLLGLAFQARDDVLGIWGDAALLGKATGADIRRKKQSLPVVYGFLKADATQRRRLVDLYSRPELDDDDVSEVVATLEDLGALHYAQGVAEEQGVEALRIMRNAMLDPRSTAVFEGLASFMLHRDH